MEPLDLELLWREELEPLEPDPPLVLPGAKVDVLWLEQEQLDASSLEQLDAVVWSS